MRVVSTALAFGVGLVTSPLLSQPLQLHLGAVQIRITASDIFDKKQQQGMQTLRFCKKFCQVLCAIHK